MNTNRDYSAYVRLRQARANSAYNQQAAYDVVYGIRKITTGGGSANRDSSFATSATVGSAFFVNPALATPPAPPYVPTAYYEYYTTPGLFSWQAPPDIVGPITYFMVGGGGGGGGAYNNSSGGGGGAGQISMGTYDVVPGQIYPLIVGEGGDGGIANSAGGITPVIPLYDSNYETSGLTGGESVFDYDKQDCTNPVACGGGPGVRSRYYPNPGGSSIGGTVAGPGGTAISLGIASTGGNGGGGGGSSGGGGGTDTNGANGAGSTRAAGGAGSPYAFPGINNGNPVEYGVGGPGSYPTNPPSTGAAGAANTGNGGGGAGSPSSNQASGGKGGSGIVIIKYFM